MNEKLNSLKPIAISGGEPIPDGYPAWLEDLDTGTKYLIPYGSWTLGRQSEESEVDIPIRTSADNMLYISKKQGIVTLKRNLIGENALYLRDCKNVANPPTWKDLKRTVSSTTKYFMKIWYRLERPSFGLI